MYQNYNQTIKFCQREKRKETKA